MKTLTRCRIIWIIIAATAAYAAFNLAYFAIGGTFGPGWLVAGLLVYGSLFASSILLAVAERPETADAGEAEEDEAEEPKPTRSHRELLFDDGDATIVREVDEDGDADIVVVANGSSSSVRDIERAVDDAEDEPGSIVKWPATKKQPALEADPAVEKPRQA